MEKKQLTLCMINIIRALNVSPGRISPCHRASQSDCFYIKSNESS